MRLVVLNPLKKSLIFIEALTSSPPGRMMSQLLPCLKRTLAKIYVSLARRYVRFFNKSGFCNFKGALRPGLL
jgi:hypothetical protein